MRPHFIVGTDIAFLCVLARVDFQPSIESMAPVCFARVNTYHSRFSCLA